MPKYIKLSLQIVFIGVVIYIVSPISESGSISLEEPLKKVSMEMSRTPQEKVSHQISNFNSTDPSTFHNNNQSNQNLTSSPFTKAISETNLSENTDEFIITNVEKSTFSSDQTNNVNFSSDDYEKTITLTNNIPTSSFTGNQLSNFNQYNNGNDNTKITSSNKSYKNKTVSTESDNPTSLESDNETDKFLSNNDAKCSIYGEPNEYQKLVLTLNGCYK